MVIGDQKKFLSVLLTLKTEVTKNGRQTSNLTKELKTLLSVKGQKVSTVDEAKKSTLLKKLIDNGIKKANLKAVSRAANIRKWNILPVDFSV